MKRLNPATGAPFKRGDVREDGYVFLSYGKSRIKRNGLFSEYWLNPEKFIKQIEKTNIAIEKWHKQNLDKNKTANEKWRKKNLDKDSAYSAKRRAAKIQRTPNWLTKDQLKQIEVFYTKAKLLSDLTGQIYHVDHIVPLQGENVSGLHVPWNLQLLTASENCSKNNSYAY